MLLSNPFTHDPRVYNEARGLIRNGHEVTIVAWDRAGREPAQDEVNGIRVERVGHTRWMRALPYDILRLRGWWRAAARRAVDIARDRPFQAIHCHDLDTLPAGVRLKRRFSVPLLYDSHEFFPAMLRRDLPEPVPALFAAMEKRLIHHVDHIVAVNPLLLDRLQGLTRHPRPGTVVMNAKRVPSGTWQAPPAEGFVALYIGTLNESRFLTGILDATQDMDGIELRIGGIGKPAYVTGLQQRIDAHPNASFLGRVPPQEVVPQTLAAHVVLCMTDPSDLNNSFATANKQFEAMAAGRPILVSQGTYIASFTEEHGLGIAVPHTRLGVRQGLERLRDDPELGRRIGRHALEEAMTRFNWPEQERRLAAIYAGWADGMGTRGGDEASNTERPGTPS